MHIGVIGLGRMGSIFAKRLLDQNHSLHLWNRSADPMRAFADTAATCCATPAEVVSSSEVVLVSLANEAALDAVYRGEDGILSAPLHETYILETSTVRPEIVVALAAQAAQAGGAFVDAPVLGTVGPAREGKLVILTGGDPSAIEKVRPVLSGLSRRHCHMGAVGMGLAMKLVVNMCLCVYWQSLGEALAMGGRQGLDFEAMLDVLVDSPIATAALNGKLSVLRGGSAEIGFDVAGARKDLSSALMTAQALDVPATAAAGALAGFAAAVEGGFGEKDVAAIVAFNRTLMG